MDPHLPVDAESLHKNQDSYKEIIDVQLPAVSDESDTCYYISFLTDRFLPVVDQWTESLSKKFNKKYKPIFVLPYIHNSLFSEENYIVVNPDLQIISNNPIRDKVVAFNYSEDLVETFSSSTFATQLIDLLYNKQGKVPILSFSSVWLQFDSNKTLVLGPDPTVAEKYDDKTTHMDIFKALGLPLPNVSIKRNWEAVLQSANSYPFYVSAAFSSSGVESRIINAQDELQAFYDNLRKINKSRAFYVADVIPDIAATPNTTAIVLGKDRTVLVNISDQILLGTKYLGNIYPTTLPQSLAKQVSDMTIAIGNYISQDGFKGLFGCDFLITKDGTCYPTDLNPRRQGGYTCITLSSKVNLTDLELSLFTSGTLASVPEYDDFQVPYSWGHTKLVPPKNNMRIVRELKDGDPLQPFNEVGFTFAAQYYPKDTILAYGAPGYYATSGETHNEVKRKLLHDSTLLIQNIYAHEQ